MNLYRFMTDVRAGADRENIAPGSVGLVTLWVRAESEGIAVARAERILEKRHYESVGPLNAYLEESAGDSPSNDGDSALGADPTRAGYEAMKQRALDEADGLFEAWQPGEDKASKQKPGQGVAA